MSRRKMSLRTKAIILVSLFMVVTNLALGAALVNQSRKDTKTQINERMLDIVNTAAAMLDGDVLGSLTAEDEGTGEYQNVYNTLARFRDNFDLDYIYYVRDMGDGNFTFGIDTDPVAPGAFGSPVVYTDALYNASQGVPSVDEKPYEDRWGRFYSAFSPVFDSHGKVAGVVTADFNADWYDEQLNRSMRIIIIACALFVLIGVGITFILTRQFDNQLKDIKKNVNDLADDLNSLTNEFSGQETEAPVPETSLDDNIQTLADNISRLKSNLHEYINHSQTQANNMITAMASDYRAVYYVNLDENVAICYRTDHRDRADVPEGGRFIYTEHIRNYAANNVSDDYREGFLEFVDPEHIRESLATQPIIAYRYLARRADHEYYEMIRMAGVRQAVDREDHIVHSIGLGFTEIDAEMRESMAKNKALADALSLAEEASIAKTAFLSNMSHEIRTPMNAIIGLDTLALHDDTISSQTREYLEKIGSSARHLLDLINDILDMSRIEAGRMVLRKEEFSFSFMLEQINTMVMAQCSEKGLTYECHIPGRMNDYYIGDDMKLKEVLINILSNAIKFTEAPGNVTLTVERIAEFEDQSTLRFCVEDTGIGMDPQFIPKIFDSFSQEDSSTKTRYGSTGLGMAVTKRIVEMMNGTITVESEKGVGSKFTVVITLRNVEHEERTHADSIDINQMNVLVVDDDEVAAEHTRTMLDEVGIRTDVCNSGAEALRMMEVQHTKQEPYNLVLMDYDMPEMNGLDVTREIRKLYGRESMVVVLMTYHWDDIREDAMAAGVDSFLSKPLFVTDVIKEFELAAHRNNANLFREKKRASLEGRRILLAEDVELNAEIIIDVLDIEDVTTDHAENGRKVVEMFQSSEPGYYSAILMDVRMPEMDGLEAAAAIRSLDRPDAKQIPIIALTANAFDEDVQRSLQAGMNAHLTKPLDPDRLYQTLGELIYENEA